jgi:hypothetical protein
VQERAKVKVQTNPEMHSICAKGFISQDPAGLGFLTPYCQLGVIVSARRCQPRQLTATAMSEA